MFKLNFKVNKKCHKNGLECLYVRKNTEIISINIAVKVGAMNENLKEKGISHFIEHMLFKGTKNRNNEILNEELESMGGDYNAYTDYDSTVYTVSCLKEEFEKAIILLSDMLINSNFPEDELKKERSVILSEMRSDKDDIESFSFKMVNEVAFQKSQLKYDVSGLEKNVKKFTRDELEAYYKKYYSPKNTIITIVSPYNDDYIDGVICKYFSKWTGADVMPAKMIEEKNIETRITTYKKELEQCAIIYLYTFYDLKKEEELPLRILNNRLGESSNSLLFREIREKRGLAYDIYTNLDISKNIKTLYIYTAVSKYDVDKALKAINDTINKVVEGEIVIGEKDLEVMKKVHKTAVFSTIEDSNELCSYIMNQELDEENYLEFIDDMEKLKNIDISSVMNVAKKVLRSPTIHILKSKN